MNDNSDLNSFSNINLKDILETYTRRWIFFLVCIALFLGLAFLYIRYSVPQYTAEAKIQILEENGKGSELDLFADLNVLSGSKNKIEDEIQSLGSRSNFIEVTKKLGLNKTIKAIGNIIDTEMYENPPFIINFIAPDSLIYSSDFSFFVEMSAEFTYGYKENENETFKVYTYGSSIKTSLGDLVITPNFNKLATYKGRKYYVSLAPLFQVAQFYQKNTQIVPLDEQSNIINISLNSPVQNKAKNIIDVLIEIYNKNGIDDKKQIADRTSDFIDDRITEIYSDLSSVDQTAQDFKTQRGLTDIASEADLNLNIGSVNQQELQNTILELDMASSMKAIIENQEGYEILPSNIGLSDPSIVATTARYNDFVAYRNRLLKSSNEKNPIIVNLDQQLSSLKSSMQRSLNSMINNLGLQMNSLSNQISKINSKIYAAPKNERALRDISRQQQTTESLYLYLLEKREEAQITFASARPMSKIIDKAYVASKVPVSPKPRMIYLGALIIGFLLPFSFIYIDDLLDTKIHSKVNLEGLVNNVPVLGEIPRLTKKHRRLIVKDDRSVLAESLRMLRTNLDFIIKSNGKDSNNVVFITSSVSGEGKSFLSSNLAMILANTNKKVLLLGADIRNPKLHNFFVNNEGDKNQSNNRVKDVGLTEYLYDTNLSIADIVIRENINNNKIDVIYSGKVPPNPAELLMGNRMKELLKTVSNTYDYVIVDTAPLMVVADTLLISSLADHIIYVLRAGTTETKVIGFPLKLIKEGKLKNLSFVVNDVKASNLGYNGYGYGYAQEKPKWWKF
jgi:tyrosine-protein kinase Etk/Wzc